MAAAAYVNQSIARFHPDNHLYGTRIKVSPPTVMGDFHDQVGWIKGDGDAFVISNFRDSVGGEILVIREFCSAWENIFDCLYSLSLGVFVELGREATNSLNRSTRAYITEFYSRRREDNSSDFFSFRS